MRLWDYSKKVLPDVFPKYKKFFYIPLDILIFTTKFLCKIDIEYYCDTSKNQKTKLKIRSRIPYLDGKIHGVVLEWYENGKNKKYKIFYNKGSINGKCIKWYRNGKLEKIEQYRKGKLHGKSKLWYNNGNIMEINPYYLGRLHGKSKSWKVTGQKRKTWIYRYGHLIS